MSSDSGEDMKRIKTSGNRDVLLTILKRTGVAVVFAQTDHFSTSPSIGTSTIKRLRQLCVKTSDEESDTATQNFFDKSSSKIAAAKTVFETIESLPCSLSCMRALLLHLRLCEENSSLSVSFSLEIAEISGTLHYDSSVNSALSLFPDRKTELSNMTDGKPFGFDADNIPETDCFEDGCPGNQWFLKMPHFTSFPFTLLIK